MTKIDDLYTLTLADGLKVQRAGQDIRYKVVKLREIGVADERIAVQMAERVVTVDGRPVLLLSQADHRYALTSRHIESFQCDGMVIGQDMIDLNLLGKLSLHDLGLIEDRVFLINLAAKVRYGLISEDDFDRVVSGLGQAPASPQPQGQAEGLGAPAAGVEPGPQMLADFAGSHAAVAAGSERGLSGAAG